MGGWGGDSRSQLRVADTLCHDIFAGILSWFVFVCCAVFVVWYFSTRVKGTWTSSKTTAAMTMERTVSLFFQDVLRCIGGMKIFLPLLEQISFFEPREIANGVSEPGEVAELEKHSEEKENDERSEQSIKPFS